MFSVILILMLPAILSMSVFRLCQLPRELLAGRMQFNPVRRNLALTAFLFMYVMLTGYTLAVVYVLGRAIAQPPRVFQELFPGVYVPVLYPLIYLGFEWVIYHCVKRPLGSRTSPPSTAVPSRDRSDG
jgi:hypothetical protein